MPISGLRVDVGSSADPADSPERSRHSMLSVTADGEEVGGETGSNSQRFKAEPLGMSSVTLDGKDETGGLSGLTQSPRPAASRSRYAISPRLGSRQGTLDESSSVISDHGTSTMSPNVSSRTAVLDKPPSVASQSGFDSERGTQLRRSRLDMSPGLASRRRSVKFEGNDDSLEGASVGMSPQLCKLDFNQGESDEGQEPVLRSSWGEVFRVSGAMRSKAKRHSISDSVSRLSSPGDATGGCCWAIVLFVCVCV